MVKKSKILRKNNLNRRKVVLQKNTKEKNDNQTDDIRDIELINLKRDFYKSIKKNIQYLEQDKNDIQSKSNLIGKPKINIELKKELKYIDGIEITQIVGIADIERKITAQNRTFYINQLLPLSIVKIKEK